MKRRIFLVCLFYCFFRLPIYESIAAFFWQSASYVIPILLTIAQELLNFANDKNFLIDFVFFINHLSSNSNVAFPYLSNSKY